MTEGEAREIFASGEDKVVETLLVFDARIRELTARLHTDSRNSSKPPSTDGFHKPAPKSRRVRSGRKPGGQVGHAGTTLALSESPDEIVSHPVDCCIHCGFDLSGGKAEDVDRRQVFDIPPPRMVVTEHRFETKICPACHMTTSSADSAAEDVSAPVQYGPRMKALGVYLKAWQLLPFKRGAELIRTLFGCSLCEGTLSNMVKGISGSLDTPLSAILGILTSAKVAHFDETGGSVQGKRHWFHVASTEGVTLYAMHPKRGTDAMENMGVLPRFTGTAVHDHWKPYYTFDDCSHGLCNAHHLRELTFVHEVVGQGWAKLMKDLLLRIKAAVDLAKTENRTSLDGPQLTRFIRRYRDIVVMGIAANPAPLPVPGKRGRRKDSKAGNLVRRLKSHRSDVLAFMHDFSIPFDNNLAERDLRMMKVQQKISGTFRSESGADFFCQIRSYLSTARKHGLDRKSTRLNSSHH